jgi:hypothetical protein
MALGEFSCFLPWNPRRWSNADDEMAVEAVPSEPLSRPDSLLSGIFHELCRECPWHYPSILMNPGRFLAHSLDSAPTEQGIQFQLSSAANFRLPVTRVSSPSHLSDKATLRVRKNYFPMARHRGVRRLASDKPTWH